MIQFGIGTFGEVTWDGSSGNAKNAHQRVQEILEMAQSADQWSLDIFALGEHHRSDYVVSSPQTILAAIAAVTSKIRLSSAVTVLSSSDPVRIFQQFATLDLISSGRAEIMVGRGSFIESFPLFGFDLKDYNNLFTEKLQLLMNINQNEIIKWKGKYRTKIDRLGIYPRPLQKRLPIWIAVGGTPSSVIRAAKSELPFMLGILGTDPRRFTLFTDLYKENWTSMGYDSAKMQIGINEHLYISDNHEQAINEYWPVYGRMMNKIGQERGWPPMDKQDFRKLCEPEGSLLVGTPDEVAEKLIYQYGLFGYTRFIGQIIFGQMEQEKILHSVELFANEVVGKVRDKLKSGNSDNK